MSCRSASAALPASASENSLTASNRGRPVLERKRPHVVQHHRLLQVRQAVDLSDHALRVYQKHLEHVIDGARRLAGCVALDPDVLPETSEERQQMVDGRRGEELPFEA